MPWCWLSFGRSVLCSSTCLPPCDKLKKRGVGYWSEWRSGQKKKHDDGDKGRCVLKTKIQSNERKGGTSHKRRTEKRDSRRKEMPIAGCSVSADHMQFIFQ